jgi:hypothetical protein
LSDGSEDARTGHQRGGEIENRCAGGTAAGMMDRRQPNRGKAFYHAVHRRARTPRHPRRPSIIPPPSFSDPTHPVRPRADSEALVAAQTQHASIPKATGKGRAVVEKSRRSFSTPSFTFACFPIVHPLPRRIPWFWNVSLCCPSEFQDGHGCQKEYPCSAPLPPGRRTTCQQ